LDGNGDPEAWMELYNDGTSPVNLNGFKLQKASSLETWDLTNISIPGKSYLTVLASGKSKKQIVHHWETAILANSPWQYWISPPFLANRNLLISSIFS
jgi:hypothetical protein